MSITKPTKDEQLLVANDLGYSSVKAEINGDKVFFPSILAIKKQQDIFDPIEFSSKEQEKEYMNDFMSHLDMSVISKEVKLQGRFLVGDAAVESHLQSTREFDVNDLAGKSDTDLAIIFTLAAIAGKRVKDAYEKSGSLEGLSEELNAVVTMATALPVLEGKTGNKIENYKQRFLNSTHTIIFHNFSEAITVKVKFTDVFVNLEGSVAQFAIINSNQQMKKDIKEYFDANYSDFGDVPVEDIVRSQNVLNIDIGHGTVDIVSIIDGSVNPNSSNSLAYGYGNALTAAMNRLESEGKMIGSQAELQAMLSKKVSPLMARKQKQYRETVYDQLDVLTDKIVTAVSQVLRNGGTQAEIVFVHGGGSIPMKEQSNLKSELDSKLRAFNGGDTIPVIWINPEYAQTLNERGLALILKSLAN